MAKRTGRLRHQLPHCYYEGYLEKRSFKDKTSRKLWTCLCGNTLFFFNDKRDSDYVEKVELNDFVSLTDDNSLDRNLDTARMTLQLKQENIKISASNTEARELWKGFILSIAKLSVPSSLNLLPGQIHILKEAVDKEKMRLENATSAVAVATDDNSSPYVNPLADMPVCYHKVTRLEAEMLLERESSRGNLLMRPSGNKTFAITTRQVLEDPEFKHYRVTRRPEGGFAIDVEYPIHCETLHDVINFFVCKTEGSLTPLILEETYERSISFIQSDNENGERSIQRPSTSPIPPNVPPKPARVPTPEPESVMEECIYLNDVLIEEEEKTEDNTATPPVTEVAKPPKKAIMPPVPTPRRVSSSPALNQQPAAILTVPTTLSIASRIRCNTNPLGETISELKLILERKSKCLE